MLPLCNDFHCKLEANVMIVKNVECPPPLKAAAESSSCVLVLQEQWTLLQGHGGK